MKLIYEEGSVPKLHEQVIPLQLVAEHEGNKFKVVFAMDASYASQSNVSTYIYSRAQQSWNKVLEQTGTANAVIAAYYGLEPAQRGEWLRTWKLETMIKAEMRLLVTLAAKINA